MMLMMLLLMWHVIIRADDPWMESLLRMLRGQTPQKRLLVLLLLLLPHAVHFEMHLTINKYTSSKGKKKTSFLIRLPVQSTFARRRWPL